MNANKELWESGDFTRIANTFRESAKELVNTFGINPGQTLIDIGCGDGSTAIPAAMLGADVLGVDISSKIVAAGTKRAEELGVQNCKFQEGVASELQGIRDNSYDVVVSIFGAMFDSRPFETASQMVRVCKPGGKIYMGNWIPNDPSFASQMLNITYRFSPPPPAGYISPMTWGVEANVIERFGKAGIKPENISFEKRDLKMKFDGKPEEFLDEFRFFYSPLLRTYAYAKETGKEAELHGLLIEYFRTQNESKDPNKLEVSANFLLIKAQA